MAKKRERERQKDRERSEKDILQKEPKEHNIILLQKYISDFKNKLIKKLRHRKNKTYNRCHNSAWINHDFHSLFNHYVAFIPQSLCNRPQATFILVRAAFPQIRHLEARQWFQSNCYIKKYMFVLCWDADNTESWGVGIISSRQSKTKPVFFEKSPKQNWNCVFLPQTRICFYWLNPETNGDDEMGIAQHHWLIWS